MGNSQEASSQTVEDALTRLDKAQTKQIQKEHERIKEHSMKAMQQQRDYSLAAGFALLEIQQNTLEDTQVQALLEFESPYFYKLRKIIIDETVVRVEHEPVVGTPYLDLLFHKKSISLVAIKKIVRHTLQGFRELHNQGLFIRDFNPNILFEQDQENYKIFYLGNNYLASQPKTKFNEFIAPEVASGWYNEKCDIYSLGVFLHLLIYGTFPDKSELPVERQGVTISQSCRSFLQSCLCLNQKLRPSASTMLKHKWLAQVDLSQISNSKVRQYVLKHKVKSSLYKIMEQKARGNRKMTSIFGNLLAYGCDIGQAKKVKSNDTVVGVDELKESINGVDELLWYSFRKKNRLLDKVYISSFETLSLLQE